MRGRTFKNSYIIADEMQNATPNQMKMLLTRIEGSLRREAVDLTQALNQRWGLMEFTKLREKNSTHLNIVYFNFF